jgi:glutaredoxin-related protein
MPIRRFAVSPVRPFAHSPTRLLPLGSFFSEICPQAASSFVRIQNMNIDYGFFHLFKALQSLRPDKTQSALPESRSEVEVTLPKINYSLLGSQPVQQRRCQQRALRWQQFELMNAAAAGRQPIHL